METKFKVLTVVLIAAIMTSVFAIAVPTMAQETEEPSEDEVPPIYFGFRGHRGHRMEPNGMAMPWLLNQFNENAISIKVEGELTALERNILIVKTEKGEIVNVVVPSVWMIGDKVYDLRTFIDFELLNVGDTIVVQALRTDLMENEDASLSIYVLFGYVISDGETTAYAVLPFNIEASASSTSESSTSTSEASI
jgi:hypothetical protein